jgi:glucose/arabinose dehydrogenase
MRQSPLTRRQVLAAAGVAALAGCIGDDSSEDVPEPVPDEYDHPTPADSPDWEPAVGPPQEAEPGTETLVENLEIPWDLAFTGDGELFLTERTGSILRFESGEVAPVASPREPIDAGSVKPGSDERPWWVEGGEGGTLGIAIHPDYPAEPMVYVYYTADGGSRRNRVVRYDVSASDPAATEERIVDDIPAEKIHNGGRIAFGPDDNLWICTGDASEGDRARDLDSLAGKVLRVDPSGRPLETNPDLDGDPRVFTYGHRNPQGIDWLPSGVPVVTEHGPTGRDEIQVLRPGGDYGWDEVRGPPGDENYESYADHGDVVPPLVNTGSETSWAPTGATFYTDEKLPAFHNRYLFGGLGSQALYALTLTPSGVDPPPTDWDAWRYDAGWLDGAYTATVHRLLEDELGRIRRVAASPSGELYAITSNRDGRAADPFPRERDDVLVRITP